MHYSDLNEVVIDLEKHGHLIRIKEPVDPNLELGYIHRRIVDANGPALLFENVLGTPFPCASNLFGTHERSQFLFRKTLHKVKKLLSLKAHPEKLIKFWEYLNLPPLALKALPKKTSTPKVCEFETKIDQLPQVVCWPEDGGAFITLPQVFTRDPDNPSLLKSNLGMYRIQLSGNEYKPNEEIGLHYQLHRGIGVHHSKAIEKKTPLKVSIFVGGPPSHTLAAVMPLPEGISELHFSGLLNNSRFRYGEKEGHIVSADADFCITGTIIDDKLLPEGPFGDHLGYYSLTHPFPVMKVEHVYHKKNAIWPLTIVGRPPQEDSQFGALIHELTDCLVPKEIPGVHALHAVDSAGVHPLLLSIGSERYVPYAKKEPKELLTIANAILGFGQCSLAKYLFIIDKQEAPKLDIHNVSAYFSHVLERVMWERDLHFQTKTTIDTLDYSGKGLNAGSKVVIAACGEKKRKLSTKLSFDLPNTCQKAFVANPGILCLETKPYTACNEEKSFLSSVCESLEPLENALQEFPLIVLCDDAEFTAESLHNFLWVTFTRSNPSADIWGIKSYTQDKHWGCKGSLIIDARIKPHHAPALVDDSHVVKKAERFFKKGGVLNAWDS